MLLYPVCILYDGAAKINDLKRTISDHTFLSLSRGSAVRQNLQLPLSLVLLVGEE